MRHICELVTFGAVAMFDFAAVASILSGIDISVQVLFLLAVATAAAAVLVMSPEPAPRRIIVYIHHVREE